MAQPVEGRDRVNTVAAHDHAHRPLDHDSVVQRTLKLLSEELPGYVVYESPALLAHSSALRNVEFDFPGPPRSTEMFNLHEWEIVK